MNKLADSLKNLDLFANVPDELAARIIADAPLQKGAQGDLITIRPVDYFVLVDGAARLIAQASKKTMAELRSAAGEPPDCLYALTLQQSIELTAASDFIILDGERIDTAIEQAQQPFVLSQVDAPAARQDVSQTAGSHDAGPSDMKKMTGWLRSSKVFAQMDLFDVVECAMALQPFEAGAGWDIVREGSEGNFFYLIESGSAEVWRSDAGKDGSPQKLADLGPGDSFGEEALLQDSCRNATVRMVAAGRLWRLEKSQFDELVRDSLLQEIDANDAMKEMQDGKAGLIDCRYAREYGMTRIPGATLIPLDRIREDAASLDRSKSYLVYCRSGKRSRAAAFLMQRMGLDAKSIRGGLTAWPFDVEGNS